MIADFAPVRHALSAFTAKLRCVLLRLDEGCQSARGNAERGGVETMKLRHFLRCLPLTNSLSRKLRRTPKPEIHN